MDFRAVCYLLVTLAAEVLGQNYTNGTNSTDDGCVHFTSSHLAAVRGEGNSARGSLGMRRRLAVG